MINTDCVKVFELNQLWNQVSDQVEWKVLDKVEDNVEIQVWFKVYNQVRIQVWEDVFR